VIRTNRALLHLLGLKDFADVLGKDVTNLFPGIDADFFDFFRLEDSNYVTRETRVDIADSGTRILQFSAMGLNRQNDSFVLLIEDKTDRSEEAARQENLARQEAIHALMGALMHHLNQPLTVISVGARLMQIALERGDATTQELKQTFDEISSLAMNVSETLKKVNQKRDFQTEPYVEGIDILEIER
jgi:nitrogen-specific signal transduction histidine kinase